ncbi:MAG: M23 family metallopeptidase [Oscillospiraceae bacterium]|nr:M23 family metallopeptidase [Oscillospiraceae bacterium]
MNVTYNNLEHAKVRIDEFGKVFFNATEPGIYKLKFEYKTPRGIVVKRATVRVKVYTIKDFTKQPVKASTKGARFAYYWKPSTERKYFGRRFSENISEPYEIYRILFCDGRHWVQTKISGKSAYIPFEHADKEAIEKALGGEWIYMFRGERFSEYVTYGVDGTNKVNQTYPGHNGLDITGLGQESKIDFRNTEYPVFSPVFGEIVEIYKNTDGRGYGATIKAQIAGDNYLIRFLHFRKEPSFIVGQKVTSMDMLGVVGDSGSPNNYHLHIDIHKNGKLTNPEFYFQDVVEFKEQVGEARWNKVVEYAN